MKRILNFVFVWFLVIQSFGVDGRAVTSIPMKDEQVCKQAITVIQWKGLVNVKYDCVNAGSINL